MEISIRRNQRPILRWIGGKMNERYLTTKEKEVAFYLCEGLTNKEIAETTKMKLITVKWYVHTIFKKYGVKTRTKLMREYLKEMELNNDLPPAA